MRKRSFILAIAFGLASLGWAESSPKEDLKEAGKAIGQGTKKAAKSVGKGSKKAAKSLGKALKEAAKKAKEDLKD